MPDKKNKPGQSRPRMTLDPRTWYDALLRRLNQDHRPDIGRSRMYQGFSENDEVAAGQRNRKAKRRAANKVARASRRINRQRSSK